MCSKVSVDGGPTTHNEQFDIIPDHLVHLFVWSSKNLDPGEQSGLTSFLLGFSGVLAAFSSYLGHTDVVHHQIDTENAKPI